MVKPWKFELEESTSDDDTERCVPIAPNYTELEDNTEEEDIVSGSDDTDEQTDTSTVEPEEVDPVTTGVTTRSGRKIKPPRRFQDYNMEM